jgi:hypothetical protein
MILIKEYNDFNETNEEENYKVNIYSSKHTENYSNNYSNKYSNRKIYSEYNNSSDNNNNCSEYIRDKGEEIDVINMILQEEKK